MNKPKKIGTAFESKIRDAINDWVGEEFCKRIVLHGNKDHGDLEIIVGEMVFTGEAKKNKQYPSEGKIEEFKRQSIKESGNAGTIGALLFVNLPNKSLMRAEVWMERRTYLNIIGIGMVERGALTSEARKVIRRWMGEGEHAWLRLTFCDFLWTVYGPPSWEWKGTNDSKLEPDN